MSEQETLTNKYSLELRDLRVSRNARRRLGLDKFNISSVGLIDITQFHNLQNFSHTLQANVESHDEKKKLSSANLNLYAINNRIRLTFIEGLINEINIPIFKNIRREFENNHEELLSKLYTNFADQYYTTAGEVKISELLRLWLSVNNPAHNYYTSHFHEKEFYESEILQEFGQIVEELDLPKLFGKDLIEYIRTPEKLYPNSIPKQLQYILENWLQYIGSFQQNILLLGLDMLKEEEQVRAPGPGPSEAIVFDGSGTDDYERFSEDLFWMPNLVLLSKNILVWLDQLSKKYGRTITTLDQIPDEELDLLKERGITGLWLIGLWERSPASKRIKHKTGNISAESSAYAIYDYRVADDLGGNQALKILKEKLMNRGIRIGTDMVPNHTGITSQWVIEHPEWFIHTVEVPFSSYSFTGEDLSSNEKVGIFLEDSYYDRSDAAVVFKHVNNENGKTRYIYHGNDGTSMPWNDTAQLDFLNPEVREAVTEKIVEIAHLFDIIRFDAAMVLTKQHIRRLWYPKSGEGGAIPSRSRIQLSDEEFESRMPVEFWREVVDRVNEQAPETLLLAEAFWLLEGYFVRTLGMHRVYNSAFMNMLRDEENSKYRQTVKNILEYNPEILKRFVNYLTTPDEEPAIKNFGDDDKYFGVATMMVTMPGLPLFGHGQFEGFEEKYGMEYRNAFHEEEVRNDLVERHHREIVPLLRKRYLFAESENFYFYDFYTDEGKVNEDVFVYSNLYQNERSLVIYNNRYSEAAGWIKTSVAFSEDDHLRQIELYDGLKLSDEEGYLLFKDHVTGLQYLRSKDEIQHKGLFATVGAFKYHVFTDFEQIHEDLEIWTMVASKLAGRGTADIYSLFNELKTQPAVAVEEERVTKPDVVEQREDMPEELEETTVEISETTELEEEEPEVTESEKLHDEIREFERQVSALIKERNALEEKVDELKFKLSELEDEEDEVQVEIDQITRDYTALEDENTKLKVQNDELTQRIELLEKEVRELKDRERLTSDLNEESLDEEEGPISTNLVENIIRRLTNYPKGLRLRNLAMSMGINMHTALRYSTILQERGWVDIVYKDSEDSNPLIVMKKTS